MQDSTSFSIQIRPKQATFTAAQLVHMTMHLLVHSTDQPWSLIIKKYSKNFPSHTHKWHLDRFNHFCRDHERDQQHTGRQTDHANLSTATNRNYLLLWCGLKIPWAHPSQPPKQHRNRFSRFSGSRTWPIDRHRHSL